MKQIVKYLRPYKLDISVGVSIKFLGTIAELFIPWILSYIIDDVIPLRSIAAIVYWGFLMFICAVSALVFNIIANRKAAMVSRNTTEHIRRDLFRKIIYLSSHQVDEISTPSLISRATTDTYNIHQMLGMLQRMGIRAPIMFLGGILITLTLDPVLTLAMISVMPVLILVIIFVAKIGIPMYTVLQSKIDCFVRVVREDVTGIRVIKALSKEAYEQDKFKKASEDVVDQEQKAGMVMASLNPVMNLCLNLGIVLVVLVGAYRVHSGVTQPGKIIAFLSYVTLILNALLFVSKMFINYSKASASAKRIHEILERKEELTIQPKELVYNDLCIEFDDVCFSYNKKENNLDHISFGLKKGETLGIIGATGSGKSTIVNLLLRLYEVDFGTIRINGENIKSLDTKELREKFGIVFQNDFLYSDTILENIRFGRHLDVDEVVHAAGFAKARDFIEGREEGFYAPVSIKGANLSGGQKQRLLISRALAGHPEILILDDSSSALDYKTDAAFRKELREHFTDTTAILIAQRISSIMSADHILVLDEGKIAGYGTHQELLKTCESYLEINQSQMGEEQASDKK